MTNDTSKTITSTAPAPEGNDSTRKRSNAILLPVAEGGQCSTRPGRRQTPGFGKNDWQDHLPGESTFQRNQ